MTLRDVLRLSEVFACVLSGFKRVMKNVRLSLTFCACFDIFSGILIGLERF